LSSFYKMDPAAWDFGTAELTLEQEAAYLRVVNAIHKHDAPVPNNDRVLAGLFRTSTRKARALISELIDAGKLVLEGDKIWNERARSDMVHRQFVSGSASVRGSKGGRTRAENASKSLENNDAAQATASSRIEENRIDNKREAKASPKTGSRLNADWFLPASWGEWALSEGASQELIRIEASKFKDYWIGLAGAKARKADWQATWRNWIRKAIADAKPKFTAITGGQHVKPANKSQQRMDAFLRGAQITS
jgi:uncharacterized protein YdaU (DUF1376 family)